jgi:hypothetical protein
MTDFNRFKESPWKCEHDSFGRSDLAIRPAPEYASSEVLLSALYRRVGLPDLKESDVPSNGREVLRRVETGKVPVGAALRSEDWSRVLQGSLESPKLPNQSEKRFLQLTPLVPEVARYSGSARLAGNPWSPGDLIERMVMIGSPSPEAACKVWRSLYDALSVGLDDDVWARWLESELAAWRRPDSLPWKHRPLSVEWPTGFAEADAASIQFPAKQFVKDLVAIIDVKPQMTRRQWTSLLESVIRVASVAHVLWLCDVGQRAWTLVRAALLGSDSADRADAAERIYPRDISYFPFARAAMEQSKLLVSRYLYSRLGLNSVLWGLDAIGAPFRRRLSNAEAIQDLALTVARERTKLLKIGVMDVWQDFHDTESRTLSCAKGIGSNMLEFVRHAAGQRQTAREVLRGYDQGYSLRKRSQDSRSRWIVALGPVAVIAMAHCCLYETGGARSVHRLCEHLARYGIVIGKDEVGASDLGHQLRLLGLVLDSPDAESGILVLPPFAARRTRSSGAAA